MLVEFAWAFQFLSQAKANDNSFYELFDLKKSASLNRLFKNIIKIKKINTYSFDSSNNKVIIKDISTLDASSDDESIAEWGGLSSFSSKASDIISKLMANED